jgi:hypothetical protein
MVAILLTIFFGPKCPLIQEGFKPLAGLLQDPKYFHNYTLVNWAALTWKAHLVARAFFNHKGVGLQAMALACTILDIALSNYKFRVEVLPMNHPVLLQVRPQAGDPHSPSGIQWNLLEGPPPLANARSQTIVQLYKPQYPPKEPQWWLGSAP